MFCTRCGARNLDTDQFCRSCNAPLVIPGAQQQPGAPSDSVQSQSPYSTPGAGQQEPAPQNDPPYPGYQGYPSPQASYAHQVSVQQVGASGRAIAAMILSIVSLLLCCLACCLPIGIFTLPISIVGIVLGKMEMSAISEGRAPQAGETMAKVGFYLGIVSAAISFLLFALNVLGIISFFTNRSY